MKKGKKIYFGLLLIIVFLISTMYFSYAFFTSKNEEHGKLNIVAGTLDYKIESNNLQNNEITVLANEIEKVELSITSLNEISSKYELYYNTSDSTDLEIGYSNDSEKPPSGEIAANSEVVVTVIIKNNSDSDQTISFGVQGGLINNTLVLADGLSLNNEITLCNYETGEVFAFDYTGDSQLFTTLCEGNYQVELWGASGGDYEENLGGQGGYTRGNIYLDEAENFYLYVGSKPTDYNGGYNGGADGGTGTDGVYTGGGGATDIRLTRGEWNLFNSLKSRIMVVSAGAGTGYYISRVINGGDAGGLQGYDGILASYNSEYVHSVPTGGTQICGGIGAGGVDASSGQFGYGKLVDRLYGTGGGSGYYAGGSGRSSQANVSSGAGGSSFISGHDGCDAITETSTEDNITHTGQSLHYSGYSFTDTVMIDGLGYQWTTEKGTEIVGMPTHDGTNTMIGNDGNGYAKITYLGKSNVDELLEYNLESEDLENNQITVAANTMQKITVDVNSLSKISSNYELYYTADDTTDLSIGYGDENNEVSGIIGISSTKTVDIYIRNTSSDSKTLTFGVKGNLGNIVLDETENEIIDSCIINTIYVFDYIGNEENFISPCNGKYQLESWGAQGGKQASVGGYGGYAIGTTELSKKTNLYINIGGQGNKGEGYIYGENTTTIPGEGGYNGGGTGQAGGYYTAGDYTCAAGSGGGGATHIATTSGLLSELENNIENILIVSGGGGGANGFQVSDDNIGHGGGFETYATDSNYKSTQTSGYKFGLGETITAAASTEGRGGGGGGFYGGYSMSRRGIGGSGYVGNSNLTDKAMYCYGCPESEEESTKTISTTNVSEEAISEYAKIGNGYAKITYLGN